MWAIVTADFREKRERFSRRLITHQIILTLQILKLEVLKGNGSRYFF